MKNTSLIPFIFTIDFSPLQNFHGFKHGEKSIKKINGVRDAFLHTQAKRSFAPSAIQHKHIKR